MASPSQEVRELLDAMDITGKGHVVYSEFLAAAADARTCLCEEVCWNAFKHFDRNDDGSISRRELEGLLHQQDIREERICLESGVLRQMLIYFIYFHWFGAISRLFQGRRPLSQVRNGRSTLCHSDFF